MSGFRRYDQLVDELRAIVGDIAAEAKQGDLEARRWLAESFPAHQAFMAAFWAIETPRGINSSEYSAKGSQRSLMGDLWPADLSSDPPGNVLAPTSSAKA